MDNAKRLALVGGLAVVAGASLLVDGTAGAEPRPEVQRPHVLVGTGEQSIGAAAPTPPVTERVTVVADRDDDDVDGKPDAEQETLPLLARIDLVALDAKLAGATLQPASGREHARLVVNDKPLAWGGRVPLGAQVQGVSAGRVVLVARKDGKELGVAIDVHGVSMRDGAKIGVDLAREHASLERTPPARVDLIDADQAYDDPDALRVVISSPGGAALGPITVESVSSEGARLDVLRDPKLAPVECGQGMTCAATAPIRFVVDEVDRNHALVSMRSLRAEVGGAIVVRDAAGKKLQHIRVAGPRKSPVGPLGRYRVTVRPVVMRLTPGGAPAVGGTDTGALASVRQELALASAAWGQCGITFGPPSQFDVKLASPPPPFLVAIGDDVGLPASGGEVKLKIEGKPISLSTKKGWSTRQAALELQRAAQKAGVTATLSENARISPGAAPSVDVLMKKPNGELASVELLASSDPTLSVNVGAVDLTDGLQHFGDTDSVAGTLEERALVKSIEDGDPRTVELVVVPFFAGGGRIGESFIASDGSSMRNVVIIDRAGVRARRTSLTLAHELGHVILDEPGHPDDYGVDTPTLLMDSDASDSSPFGPRRLPVEDCAKVIRQAGPEARAPLLTEWKLAPLKLR